MKSMFLLPHLYWFHGRVTAQVCASSFSSSKRLQGYPIGAYSNFNSLCFSFGSIIPRWKNKASVSYKVAVSEYRAMMIR
ncbi:hypothetical protein QBC45DRAFT_411858 [Copromyces sp. CBS 386.78]|nr:hypothetical protein QBC45DRAFT_411858 [Copromyces sp. CBS 386.78]